MPDASPFNCMLRSKEFRCGLMPAHYVVRVMGVCVAHALGSYLSAGSPAIDV